MDQGLACCVLRAAGSWSTIHAAGGSMDSELSAIEAGPHIPDRERLLRTLAAVVGSAHVLADPDVVESYSRDWTGRWRGRPCAVVRPATTEQVMAVVSACAAVGVPVVPQGGNTGLVGAGVPGDGEVVLSTRRLRYLGAIDVSART